MRPLFATAAAGGGRRCIRRQRLLSTDRRGPAPLARPGDAEYCRQLVRAGDYDNYLVSLFSPRPAREAAWGVRALGIELAQPGRSGSEAAAQMRHAYWADAVESLYGDRPVQTPVTRVVCDAVRRFGISRTWLRRLVAERGRAPARPGFATVADAERHGERAYACLIHPHLEALGVRDMHADNAARAIGSATALADLVRSLPAQLAQGTCALPLDVVAQHGVDVDALRRSPRPTPPLQDAVYALATAAYTRLCGVAELYVPNAPPAALPALLAAVPVKEWLERLERANFDPFDPALQRRSLRVLWRLWRASRTRTLLAVSNRPDLR